MSSCGYSPLHFVGCNPHDKVLVLGAGLLLMLCRRYFLVFRAVRCTPGGRTVLLAVTAGMAD
eukprot:6381756-Amphidinium_carterae.1